MPLSWNDIKSRAIGFSKAWADASDERAQAQPFWIDLFAVFGLSPKRLAAFEHAVKKHGGGQGFVDLFWPGMLMVEHKSRGKSLDRAYTQALDYFPGIAERDLPRYVLVSDFARLRIADLVNGDEAEFALADLHKHIRRFAFIAGYQVQEIKPQDPVNLKAAERMGRLHDALKASGFEGHPLEVLLVRLLFCLFADDTGIFQPAQAFRAWVEERSAEDGSDLGPQLAALFQVLNTPEAKRSKALDEQLAAFPYVNGALFAEALPLAAFDRAMRDSLLDACAIDWSAISPAIFGALFQSIMDAKARRNLGAHYTSEENILKLIKPLFLDELWAEFHKVKSNRNRLFEFHKKLRALAFLDPACGCGNFLVITYRELRLLEVEVMRASRSLADSKSQHLFDSNLHQQVSIDVDQFHGIEIEEFPAQVAQVALWLADHQMNLRVSEEFGQYFARIPLKATPHIVHGNALLLDWGDVVASEHCSFVLGNPPFVGKKEQSPAQKAAFEPVMRGIAGFGVLDFVAAWYVKAAQYAKASTGGTPRCAFVSTNSITQGEQVGVLWGWLQAQGVKIHFAHRTFRWSNEARGVAAVHCVIVGFGLADAAAKVIYEYENTRGEPHAVPATNINAYLVDAPDLLLSGRNAPLAQVPAVSYGSFALDDGQFTLDQTARDELLREDPRSAPFVREFIGGEELLNGTARWCLWLQDAKPADIRSCVPVMRRVLAVQKWRASRGRATTRALAATPTRFAEVRQPAAAYVAVPTVSSERRQFIPIGFLPPTVIASNQLYVVAGATLYHFAVLTSTMHNAWVRYTCGRLKSDFRYSAAIVYNNFPWPDAPGDVQRATIEAAAQAVLDARAQFPGSTLADLYDPLTMPPALQKAHQKLDAAVDAAYGKKSNAFKTDAERVAFLFEQYQRLTSLLPAAAPAKRGRTRAARP
jgi:hypothetical protein